MKIIYHQKKTLKNDAQKEDFVRRDGIDDTLHTFTEFMNANFPYKCNYCDNQYSTEDKFLKHALTTHRDVQLGPAKTSSDL
jgi:hypothetical protein